MSTKSFKQRFQAGTGLIEVLVAILVLAVGMLGMSKLNALLIRDGGTANNRAIAVSLAQEKLDDLRGFKWLNPASSYGEGCGVGIFCFSEIVPVPLTSPITPELVGDTSDNTGGHEKSDGNLTFPTGPVSVGNTIFTRTWTSVRQLGFVQVTVTIAWADQNGAASEVLTSAIWGDDAGVTAFGAAGPGIPLSGPKVAYTPKGVPDVVPITISDGTQRETSKPLPDVSSNGLSISTEFSSVNYDSDGEQTQEDFKTLNCTCQFAASASANPAAYYTYKDGGLVVKYPETAADRVTKINGVAITSQGDSQDPLCNTCCADHHDSEDANTTAFSAATALFDPERPSGDYESNGDHKHYYYTNASQPNLGLTRVAPTSGNDYLEACRFLRVDGIYRIMQDWRLADITVMSKEDYLTNSTALSNYQTYVGNIVKGQAKTDGGTETSWSKSGLSTRDLSNRSAGAIQLLARGVYVDKVYSAPRTLDSTYYGGIQTQSIGLDSIPFNEVNVTLLASWYSSNTEVATVSNEDTPINNDVYSRGLVLVTVLAGTGNNTNISAYMLPSNSGLTGGSTRPLYANTVDYDSSLTSSGTIDYKSEIGIDRHDHRSALRKSDSLNIARSGTGTSGNRKVFGMLELKEKSIYGGGDLTKVSISGSPAVTSCTVDTPFADISPFSCDVLDTYTGTLTITTSQTSGFLINATCTLTEGSVDDCGTYYVYGPRIKVSGSCTGTGQSCSNNKLSITATGTGATCTTGITPACYVPVDASTHTWSGTITVTDSGNNAKVDIANSGTLTCATVQASKSLTLTAIDLTNATNAFVMCVK